MSKKKEAVLPEKLVTIAAMKKKKATEFYIVGIGASAGGLDALKRFFEAMPAKSGMAFVVVQHLDPTHKSLLSELIAGHTKMKVTEASDGVQVRPDCVYVIPPNKELKIYHGSLLLIKPILEREKRRAIDTFFHSLATDQNEKAIGIVLSGTGSEGTIGLKEIKSVGGITLVQTPSTAQFAGMPESAIASKVADYITAPEKMPELLLRYVKKDSSNNHALSDHTLPVENQLKKIFQLIRNQTGYDFSNYKTNTIVRRIAKRTALNQIDTIESYISFLQENPGEVEKLYKDFLIGVTTFFRDDEVFACVEKKAIPFLLKKCNDRQELRVWVCGCSTGEEAYSLAILFREALEANKQFLKVIIFASDIDKEAIDVARNGIYSEGSVASVGSHRLAKFFFAKDGSYQLKKEIREMVVFAHHNVIKDPPFSKMDLISCRNLLIYMNSDLQKRIIPVFHYSLNKDGILLLGTSESLGENAGLFTAFDPKVKIFKKKSEVSNRRSSSEYELPIVQHNPPSPIVMQNYQTKKKVSVASVAEKILLENYAPPSVIIDKDNSILYLSGDTSAYLDLPVGEASLNILEMIKKDLKTDLENAIKKSRSGKSEVELKNLDFKIKNQYTKIRVVVKPVLTREIDLGALMIVFEEKQATEEKSDLSKSGQGKSSKLTDLEKELKLTREHLQTAISELETSNENLQTTNEEYQSSNEELQSTNEELETSREELQSVNEELITVNTELSSKIEQLSQANDDLNNLLSSIEVATVFLDRDLNIKRFTPAATKIFNLIPSDIDRPVGHLTSNIQYKNLAGDVKEVLRTLAPRSAEVQAVDKTWYYMRILPYRTEENIIEGVLVTFVDISQQKNTEEKLKKSNEHLNLILENLPAVPYTCAIEPEVKILFVGKSSEKVMGFLPEQFLKKNNFWINRIHPLDKKKILAAFASMPKKGSVDLPFRWKCSDGKYRHFINYMRYAASDSLHPRYVVGVWQELEKNSKLTTRDKKV